MAGLEVQIGADAAELEKKINDAEKLINKLTNAKNAKVKLGADTGDLDKKIDDATAKLNNFKKTADATGASVKNFGGKTADAGNALTQISRIAQDAPFGFIAIGNNITAAGESMGHLVKQTGSLGGAFKALGASLAGPGGILLLISLITTAFTVMAQKGLTLGDVMDMLTGDISESRKELQKMESEIAKNAQAQVSSVNAYVYTAKNINLSMEERLIAVRKLQDAYPAYFGNLTKEQILNGDIAKTVDEVTKALKNKARAMALTNKLVGLAGAEEDIYANLNNFIVRLAKELQLSTKDSFELAKAINQLVKSGKDFNEVQSQDISNLPERLKQYVLQNGALKDIANQLRRNLYDQDQITKKINQSTAAQIKLEAVKDKAGKKVYDTPQVTGVQSFISPAALKDLNTITTFNGKIDEFGNKIRVLPGIISTSFKGIKENVDIGALKAQVALANFNKRMNDIIQNGIVDTLAGLSEAIGEAFASGGNVISAVGKSLLSTLGSILVELGKMAISTGIGILAISTALKSLNPYVAIAAGAALIALGGAVKGSIKGLGSSSGGGGGSSAGSVAGSANTGGSYSSPVSSSSFASGGGGGGSSSFSGGTVTFEISGTSLIGVLNNTLDQNKRLGGALGI